ncbi:MAG TPA: hypothetical protein VHV77_09385, partial [Pirellulales bacterium]|nr:hypothetical protein [Pirellulales bacterium]
AKFGKNRPRAQTAGIEAPAKVPAKTDSATSAKAPSARGDFKLSDFDSNKDGKISQSEAPERMAQNFDMIDANHDGAIDAREFAGLKAKIQAAQGGAPGAGGPGGAPRLPTVEGGR